jgi:hypothetical protein
VEDVMRFCLVVFWWAAVLTLLNPASAANITAVQGQVQISSSGGPFRTITGPTTCNAGDVVRAVKDGSAQIFHLNGDVMTATPGVPVTCTSGLGPHGMNAGAPGSSAAGATGGTAGATGGASAAAAGAGVSTGVLVGGGVALAVGAAAAVKKLSDDKKKKEEEEKKLKPASP